MGSGAGSGSGFGFGLEFGLGLGLGSGPELGSVHLEEEGHVLARRVEDPDRALAPQPHLPRVKITDVMSYHA